MSWKKDISKDRNFYQFLCLGLIILLEKTDIFKEKPILIKSILMFANVSMI